MKHSALPPPRSAYARLRTARLAHYAVSLEFVVEAENNLPSARVLRGSSTPQFGRVGDDRSPDRGLKFLDTRLMSYQMHARLSGLGVPAICSKGDIGDISGLTGTKPETLSYPDICEK